MKVSTVSIHPNILRGTLSVALAIGALTALSPRAHAFDLDPITISIPAVKTVGRDSATLAPIEEITVKAEIAADAEALRYHSGVALLKEKVVEAARKACDAADPLDQDDGTCVFEAVKAAKPQVDAAIARARSSNMTN